MNGSRNVVGDLPVDSSLPQLPVALDAAAMQGVFEPHLRAVGRRLERCAIDRVKYRPRRNLAVSYRLSVRDADGRLDEQTVAARFCTGGESLRRWQQLPSASLQPSMPASLHEGALDMVAWWWPLDPKLGEAARWLGDGERLGTDLLPAVATCLAGVGARLLAHDVALAQLVPELRVSARARLWVEPARGAPAQAHTVYAKADVERSGEVTQAVLRALHESPAARAGRLLTPRPLLWHADFGTQWQTALPGRALLDVEPVPGIRTSEQVGAMLAALHGTAVPASRRSACGVLCERLDLVARTLALVRGDDAAGLAQRLSAGLVHLQGAALVTLHGDLHPRNLLVHEGQLGLIDLDNVRHGPALLDLGDWIADAMYRALLDSRPIAAVWPACRAFVDAHADVSGSRIEPAALAWSVAHSLFAQRVWRCLVNLKPGRFALVPRLLALAEGILRHGLPGDADAPLQEAA
ncbi:MAG: aminoglycoside phosphotransferase family protein [Burkholderiaceae bacterium]